MLESLGVLRDLMFVLLGFSAVIVVHELGHFLAARWAGVRVDQFAVGFGQALVSYRKGLGLRRGSSTREYLALPPEERARVSETEYRLNWLPFGGYVKMLGQDDLAPGKTDDSSDSYNRKPVWKRMVIISAGVVMNVLLAAALFVFVFMMGMRVQPPVVGGVVPGSPAATARVVNGDESGVREEGLRAGDRIVRIGGRAPDSFNDVALAAAMSRRGAPVEIEVARAGVDGVVRLRAEAKESRATRMLELGVVSPSSTTLLGGVRTSSRERAEIRGALERAGLAGVEPGSRLARVNGREALRVADLLDAVRDSEGASVRATFVPPEPAPGAERVVEIAPTPSLQRARVRISESDAFEVEHLLGLTPPLRVESTDARGAKQGLRDGDVFARIGSVEWPTYAAGIAEVRRHAGREVELVVARGGAYVELRARVGRDGVIGFRPGDARGVSARTAGAPERGSAEAAGAHGADRLALPPGATVVEVEGFAVGTYAELRAALRAATREAHGANTGAMVGVAYRLPIGGAPDAGPIERTTWELASVDIAQLHALGWTSPLSEWLFEPELTTLRAAGPIGAVAMGVRQTHRVMTMTYLTLVRLFEGSVRVEHLKGPVGIAHLGTRVLDQGFIYLVFFFAIISVNLAVINFLPLPIVDGGQFVFLLIEAMTKRPVSAAVQNFAAILGLALIGGVFLLVTYNDIVGIFAG